jgi:hypothetical protein
MRIAAILICLGMLIGCSNTRQVCYKFPAFPEGQRFDLPENRLRAVEQDILLQALATISYLHFHTTGKHPTTEELGAIAEPYFHITYDDEDDAQKK